MKFKYATDDEFQGMLKERLHQLELRFKESLDITLLLQMQFPAPPNLEEALEQQEAIRQQLDQNYKNTETLLKKEQGEDTTPNRAARRSKNNGTVPIDKLKENLT